MTTNVIAVPNTPFFVDLPDTAPVLGFDTNVPFDWTLVYPQLHLSAEWVDEYQAQNGHGLIAQVLRVSIEQVQDPEKPDPDKAPDLVLHLNTGQKCVMNKTRCKLISEIADSREPHEWVSGLNGQYLEFYAGIERKMSNAQQVLLRQVAASLKKKAGIAIGSAEIAKGDVAKLFG